MAERSLSCGAPMSTFSSREEATTRFRWRDGSILKYFGLIGGAPCDETAVNGDLRAIDASLKIMQHRARLYGLYDSGNARGSKLASQAALRPQSRSRLRVPGGAAFRSAKSDLSPRPSGANHRRSTSSVKIGPTRPMGSGPNWKLLAFKPELHDRAYDNAVKAISILRRIYALARNR